MKMILIDHAITQKTALNQARLRPTERRQKPSLKKTQPWRALKRGFFLLIT